MLGEQLEQQMNEVQQKVYGYNATNNTGANVTATYMNLKYVSARYFLSYQIQWVSNV